MHIKRIVLTGAPCTGKTAVINQLESMGHAVMPEISRDYITKDGLSLGGEDPAKNLIPFSAQIWQRRSEQYHSVKDLVGNVYFDRSLMDVIAYMHVGEKAVNADFNPKDFPYHPTVFIFPPWEEIYALDNERWEPFATSLDVHDAMVKTYSENGYHLIEVPRLSVESRCQFIIDASKP
jgi:predicted ATPase